MNRIDLQPHDDGVIIPVRAKPAARKNSIDGVHDGALRISVTAAPEKGKANKAMADLLAKTLGVRKSDVHLLSGETGVHKRFLVENASMDQVKAAIEQIARQRRHT